MDKSITIRFFRVERENQNTPFLREVLDHIAGIELEARRANIGPSFDVRLERLHPDGDRVVDGEFTRIQTTNFPSEVHADGTRPLGIDGPLGHGVAFRFDARRHLLATQYDPRVISPGRMFDYFSNMWPAAKYILQPIVREDMWARFDRGPVRVIEIDIASPANLAHVEGPGQAAIDAARYLGGAYGAPVLRLEFSMGHHPRGSLSEDIKGLVRTLFDGAARGDMDVRKLRAKTDQGEGQPRDEINLIEEILSVKDQLELPDNDPNRSYMVRREYLQRVMRENV